ncbi:unnamed protein product, partial [Pleuronectes platessa]
DTGHAGVSCSGSTAKETLVERDDAAPASVQRISLKTGLRSVDSLEVEAAKCAKLTDLFGAGFTSPAAAGAPGDERGGLDNDERVEADVIQVELALTLGLPFWAGLQLQI